jgi:nucleotidyltransferase/DNA polymerase involved in DNA repair
MEPSPLTLQSFARAIVHIDGDAFFASCEQSRRPQLQGRPVVTGKERGIAASMSYEAHAARHPARHAPLGNQKTLPGGGDLAFGL